MAKGNKTKGNNQRLHKQVKRIQFVALISFVLALVATFLMHMTVESLLSYTEGNSLAGALMLLLFGNKSLSIVTPFAFSLSRQRHALFAFKSPGHQLYGPRHYSEHSLLPRKMGRLGGDRLYIASLPEDGEGHRHAEEKRILLKFYRPHHRMVSI